METDQIIERRAFLIDTYSRRKCNSGALTFESDMMDISYRRTRRARAEKKAEKKAVGRVDISVHALTGEVLLLLLGKSFQVTILFALLNLPVYLVFHVTANVKGKGEADAATAQTSLNAIQLDEVFSRAAELRTPPSVPTGLRVF